MMLHGINGFDFFSKIVKHEPQDPNEIKANRPEPYQNVCKRFAHDQSSWVVTGTKKMQELI